MPPKKKRTADTGYSVEIIGPLLERILLQPEIREDKVIRIQQMIESGTYHIDSYKIATAMLREL